MKPVSGISCAQGNAFSSWRLKVTRITFILSSSRKTCLWEPADRLRERGFPGTKLPRVLSGQCPPVPPGHQVPPCKEMKTNGPRGPMKPLRKVPGTVGMDMGGFWSRNVSLWPLKKSEAIFKYLEISLKELEYLDLWATTPAGGGTVLTEGLLSLCTQRVSPLSFLVPAPTQPCQVLTP